MQNELAAAVLVIKLIDAIIALIARLTKWKF
jgi:hypothetical protein